MQSWRERSEDRGQAEGPGPRQGFRKREQTGLAGNWPRSPGRRATVEPQSRVPFDGAHVPRPRGVCGSSELTVPRGFGAKSLQLGPHSSHTTQHVTSQDGPAMPGVTFADNLTQTHTATRSGALPSRAAHPALPSLPQPRAFGSARCGPSATLWWACDLCRRFCSSRDCPSPV